MELIGTFSNGVVVPENAPAFPDGTRARIVVEIAPAVEPTAGSTFGQRHAQFKGVAQGLPTDLAEQHDHYLHGTPKR